MRHIRLLGFALVLAATLTGCRNLYQVHGICDCQYDDHCETKQPWIGNKCGTNGTGTSGQNCANGACQPR